MGPVKDVKEEGRAREIDREIVRKHCGFEAAFAAFAAFHDKNITKKKIPIKRDTHPEFVSFESGHSAASISIRSCLDVRLRD